MTVFYFTFERTVSSHCFSVFFFFPVLVDLQIATFFSNNLDFFTSSPGYGPRGGPATLDPLQAESMLATKKKAATYLHSIQKVRNDIGTLHCVHVAGVECINFSAVIHDLRNYVHMGLQENADV